MSNYELLIIIISIFELVLTVIFGGIHIGCCLGQKK